MRSMNRGANQPVYHADIVYNEFAPTVMPVSRLVRRLGQMFLDEYAFFIREEQAFPDFNVQHGPSSWVLPRGSNRWEVHENPRTPGPLSTRG